MSKEKKKNKKVSNKKMSKKTKSILSFVFAIIFIFLIFSIYLVRLEISDKALENEFDKLLEVDLIKGDFNNRLVCLGKYRTAEKALKNYFKDYSKQIKKVSDIVSSDEFSTLLSVESYENGKVDMEKLVKYSIDTKEEIDKLFEDIKKYSTDSYIKSYSNSKIKDVDARELFMYYMSSDKAKNYFIECNKTITSKQEEIDNILDVSRDLFYFLIINKNSWIIKDNKIQFSNTYLMNQYLAYIEKLK